MRISWILALLLLLSPTSPARAAPIVEVDPATLTTDTTEHLAGVPLQFWDVLSVPGVSFSESFVGQTIAEFPFAGSGTTLHEDPTGIPTSPLTLQPNPDLKENVRTLGSVLGAYINPYTQASPVFYDGGEGSVAILFDVDQFEIGFTARGSDGGDVRVSFYARDGILIDTVVAALAGGPNGVKELAFRHQSMTANIAGVTLVSLDGGGGAYEAFRFNSVPEPAVTTLLLLALSGFGLRRYSASEASISSTSVGSEQSLLPPGSPVRAS